MNTPLVNTSTLEKQIDMTIPYAHRRDIPYRTGIVTQVLGLALLAVLYPLDSPFYTVGIMLFEVGVLLSAIYLVIWTGLVKLLIVIFVIAGLTLQLWGYSSAPEEYAGLIMIAGIGLVCLGASVMAGREAHCFGYREGWLLSLAGFPLMVLANLFFRENRVFNSLGFSILFLLLLSLVGKKRNQPLVTKNRTV